MFEQNKMIIIIMNSYFKNIDPEMERNYLRQKKNIAKTFTITYNFNLGDFKS